MEFTIDTEYYQQNGVGEIALLQLCGPIDQKSVPIFEAEIQELFKNDICRFVLDLSNTKYLNSSGLGLLINIAHKVNVVGGGIRLVNVAEKFRVLFDMLGLDSSLPIYENRDVALRSFGSGELQLKSGDAVENQYEEDEKPEDEVEGEEEEAVTNETTQASTAPLLEEINEEEDDDSKSDAVSLLNKKTLPNLKKNLAEKQGNTLKFTGTESVVKEEEKPDLYEPEKPVELEDDPNFELTGSLSDLADKITDNGISSILNIEGLEPQNSEAQVSRSSQSSIVENNSSAARDNVQESEVQESEVQESEVQESDVQQDEVQSDLTIQVSKEDEEVSLSLIQKVFSDDNSKNSVQETPKVEQSLPPSQSAFMSGGVTPTSLDRVRPSSRQPRVVQKTIEKTLQWYTVVEYYNQMKKNQTFPLTLQISKVDVVDGSKELLTKLKNTNIMLVPRFPGCQVVPERVNLDLSKENLNAEFWVTPSTSGDIPGWVETLYKGQTSSFIKTPFKIKNYYAVLITFILSFIVLLSHSSKQLDFLHDYISADQKIWGHIAVGFILLVTSFFFLKKSSPKIDIVEKLSREKMQ